VTPRAGQPGLGDQLAALGPFFALRVHDAVVPAQAPWRPLSDLVDDPGVLRARVDDVRAHLGAAAGRPPADVELRVAVSVVHLGITARLVSPALALAALAGVTQPLDLASLRWQNVLGGAFPLSVPHQLPLAHQHTAAGAADPSGLDRWAVALVDGPLQDVVHAAGTLSLSPRVLWGNVASAINGAASALAAAGPDHARQGRDLATVLLRHPALRETGNGEPGTVGFRRRSCCLIYRAAAPTTDRAVCGDCVLHS
jgi:hypothetical protein